MPGQYETLFKLSQPCTLSCTMNAAMKALRDFTAARVERSASIAR
jgi:hypothetical protein